MYCSFITPFLIEKEEKLGGLIKDLNILYPTNETPEELLNPIISEVLKHKNIEIYTSTEIKNITGSIGNFEILALKDNEELKFEGGT